ncbi:hypothetical protein [Histidinibacterium aquaticum]|uniref:DUF4412 domain-containing protein n=1 Tax=Histidinibacterium aquaticum TaxID=2613962 RepID=A0A5J5GAS0_9RHOB|nr:hypothetical protein [Histidinibacterium aquaticum]KAA9005081.1 hypothetical protein F3S47_18810 [Histidinibacterium aquaticum]
MSPKRFAAILLFAMAPGLAGAQSPESVNVSTDGITVTLSVAGETITRTFPPQQDTATMTMAPDRRSFTFRMNGTSLLFHRVCGAALDLSEAEGIEGLDTDALKGSGPAWRGSLPVSDGSYDYVAFEQGDGSYRGYTVIRMAGAVTHGRWEFSGSGAADGTEPEPAFSDAQRDLALDLLAEVLGLPRQGLGDYVTLSRLPSGGQGGFGPGVVAELALDGAGRALPAEQLRDQPCAGPEEGGPAEILTVRIFREGPGGEPPEVQVELSDPRTRDIRDFGLEDAAGESRQDYSAALSEAAAQLQSGDPVSGLAR